MKKLTSYLKLLLIIAISFALVIITNSLIKNINNSTKDVNGLEVYPNASVKEEVEVKPEYENIKSIVKVQEDNGNIGYVFTAVATEGFGGDIEFQIGISDEGKIKGFKPISHSETEGYGAGMDKKEYQESFVDVNVSNGVKVGATDKENGEIQAISGATITSYALSSGINNVLSVMSNFSENVKSAAQEMPYYYDKFINLFENKPEIHYMQEFTKTEIYGNSVKRIIRAYRPSSEAGKMELDSYLIYVNTQGFGGQIDYIIRVNKEFRVFNVVFAKHTESENYGKYIEHEKYLDAFKGLNLEKNFLTKAIKLRENPNGEKDILLISGATITSQAIQKSLNDVIDTLVKFKDYYADDSNFKAISIEEMSSDSKNAQ